jgi:hypothetical protein
MGLYLEQVDRVLAAIKTAPDRPLPNDINDLNDQSQVHGVSLAELRELAGKDWPELEANPELLECFADMVAVRHMRERGEVPPSYTAVTVCAGCGPVPIFPGVAKKVEGCPWCLNRAAGRPVPRVRTKNAT